MTVELAGLEVFGHHGATEQERAAGRTLLFDLDWDVPEAARSDQLVDTVDYDAVAACVREVSDARNYRLLEALATAVVDTLVERFSLGRVRVRVRKTGIRPGGLVVGHSAATVERRGRAGAAK